VRVLNRSTGDNSAAGPPSSVLRVVGFAAAVALGAVGVWLIVTATSQKWTELGVLAGLWGLLIGAFAAFGPRQPATPVAEAAEVPATAGTELERLDAGSERREYEARLELMLRREIQGAMSREVAALRAEVAQLRTELVEKVGGQLRLERIETTRVIGSDIEALQREVDQLKSERRSTLSLRSLPTVIEIEDEPEEQAGRRRHRDEGDGNDLLAQILARETPARHGH
jgi:hypothetical protein